MGENSSIQWTTHTFNPWVGCQRVSPGCEHCYAETYDKRVGGIPVKQRKDPKVPELRWGPKGVRNRTSAENWRKPLKWNAEAAKAGRRDRVFCSSLADVFEDRPELEAWRLELFDVIRTTPHLDWLLLTKRPQNIQRLISYGIDSTVTTPWDTGPIGEWLQAWMDGRAPENVWLGTTVEDQQRANERIPELLAVPAKVRFLSCEPLLERVDLSRWLPPQPAMAAWDGMGWPPGANPAQIDWVIIGGESGGGARPFELDWARDLVRQCRTAGVAPFVKQMGSRPVIPPGDLTVSRWQLLSEKVIDAKRTRFLDPSGGDPADWPADLRVREFPR